MNQNIANQRLNQYPDVLNINQMCDILGVSTKTGYKLLSEKKIECIKVGRSYRIPKIHILTYLKMTRSSRRKKTPEINRIENEKKQIKTTR